ncbi:MAG: leucyl aminopeptidase [Rickettsiaceae bacterium]|nr:leucyl aminopeptidase [Rickettsiaceae bacterium]
MIEIILSKKLYNQEKYQCFLVAESEKTQDIELDDALIALDSKHNGIITKAILDRDNFKGSFGQLKSIMITDNTGEILYIYIFGIGKESAISESKLQDIGGNIAKTLKAGRAKKGFINARKFEGFDESIVASNIGFGVALGSYSFDKYFTKKKAEEKDVLKEITITCSSEEEARSIFKKYHSMIPAIYESRNLITEPGNVLYPETYSALIAENLEPLGVKVEIIGEAELKNMGMNALVGVGQGSSKESKLVVMIYNGLKEDDHPVALVGKGVTFDTGGISIKPSRNMGDMKYDMAGSAAVFGTIMALAARSAKANVVGVVGLVENMPGGAAQRPGDVVKSLSGQTIEIHDTDAEGRLVLADALWYTQERFKPKIMIDLATLTGAVSIALGSAYAGLFSNNEDLAEKLLNAGKKSGEELWRLPLHEAYDKMIESTIADVANLGNPPGHASSSTAAQFLQKFVNKTPWAHLDIAGVANSSKDLPCAPRGATGFGIRLLNKLISEYYER